MEAIFSLRFAFKLVFNMTFFRRCLSNDLTEVNFVSQLTGNFIVNLHEGPYILGYDMGKGMFFSNNHATDETQRFFELKNWSLVC